MTMKFLDDNLLLDSELAVLLYNDFAADLPIIDYHSHLSPKEIAEDKRFYNLTELWLKGDHYKWRLMRNCGVSEKLITGDASDKDKFIAFASVLPHCIGNPIYIWCHLELKKYFGITQDINPETANDIYTLTEKMMKEKPYTARYFISTSNVELLCTTDDPLDDLKYHKQIAADNKVKFKVLPTFRPDKALNIEADGFVDYIKALTGKKKPNLDDIISSLSKKLDFFCENGCFISDHALKNYTFADCCKFEAEDIAEKALNGEYLSEHEVEQYKTFILLFLAAEYSKRNMAMQLHFCCIRNNNTNMFDSLGPDTGFDAINASTAPHKLASFFNELEKDGMLPKTIIYSLDPNDDKVINSVINCFQGGLRGKLQHGAAWWFNDTKFGMQSHLKTLSEYSVLGNFIGMLTDSRSFTSYVRHDYFRRIVCSHVADFVNIGEYPPNMNMLKTLVKGICYHNVKVYITL